MYGGGGGDEDGGREWEMVAETGPTTYDGGGRVDDDFSVFPPSLHEGLTATLALDSPSPSSSASDCQFRESAEAVQKTKEEKAEEESRHVSRTPVSDSVRRLVDLGIDLLRSKFAAFRGGGEGCCNGGAVWSFAALAGFAGALMYMSRRHRRERELLLFLMLEKDERINQLMDQIVKMSEAIMANYKVPILAKT